MGRKTWTRAEVVTAADLNTYLMDQSIMTFSTATTRSTAIPSPTQGMVTWRNNATGPIKLEYYDGSAWTAISFTSPAQTVQGMSTPDTSTTGVTMAGSTAANTYTSWTSIGTSPGSTSYLNSVRLDDLSGFSSRTVLLVELSLDAGSTVWRRFALQTDNNGSSAVPILVTPRSCAASSTIHMRYKLPVTCGAGGLTAGVALTWTTTAPAISLSAAESLWETTSAGSSYGTWTTLGTVGAAHRLLAVVTRMNSDCGLATGASNTSIARWLGDSTDNQILQGHNRAVPSGALKISGYTGSSAWVLTEPV